MKTVRSAVLCAAVLFTFSSHSVYAQEMMPRPDDRVIIDLSSEDWVTTKTARVAINVEAAVNAGNSGTMRADMFKDVNELAKADWRLTSFNRSLDQTGLERWSTSFEARIPENQLSGLGDAVKKLSKAGMQLSVGNIDFSPTLDEMETARAGVRTLIYKQANDQLAALNTAIPGRNYRIALVNFTPDEQMPQPVQPRMYKSMAMMANAPAAMDAASASAERAEKVTLTARVVYAAVSDKAAPTIDAKH